MAVFVMLCLSHLVTSFLSTSSPGIQAPAYADNWAIISTSSYALYVAMGELCQMCEDFRLQLSYPKSWLWSVDPVIRKSMKKWTFGGNRIPVVLHERELGADVAYSRVKIC